MAGESRPTRPVPSNVRATTRVGLLWLHTTPCQLQKPTLLFQEASEPPWLSCTLKASSAGLSLTVAVEVMSMARNDNTKLMAMALMAMTLTDMLLLGWLLG